MPMQKITYHKRVRYPDSMTKLDSQQLVVDAVFELQDATLGLRLQSDYQSVQWRCWRERWDKSIVIHVQFNCTLITLCGGI